MKFGACLLVASAAICMAAPVVPEPEAPGVSVPGVSVPGVSVPEPAVPEPVREEITPHTWHWPTRTVITAPTAITATRVTYLPAPTLALTRTEINARGATLLFPTRVPLVPTTLSTVTRENVTFPEQTHTRTEIAA